MSAFRQGGKNLSGGQRQRLAIARAMIRKPDVILLDEATSALDNENEAKEALDEFARRGSALVIAHRLSTIKDSDRICVIDGGVVVESGSHAELLAKPMAADGATGGAAAICGLPLAETQSGPSASSPSVPPPLCRANTIGAVSSATKEEKCATYAKLWNAATGDQEKKSLAQIRKKLADLEEEIMALRRREEAMLVELHGFICADSTPVHSTTT